MAEPQITSSPAENDASAIRAQSQSPSPSLSPSVAPSACPGLERSVSTASSVTTSSATSAPSQPPDLIANKRRGFTRPHATSFASSARHRDSVMSLGTIAHLQHYFARTGLLDGKGAQLAREENKNDDSNPTSPISLQTNGNRVLSYPFIVQEKKSRRPSLPELSQVNEEYDASLVGSPDNMSIDENWHPSDHLHLPPTFSTYKHKQTYVPPPPDLQVLRRELREALEDAKKLLAEVQPEEEPQETQSAEGAEATKPSTGPSPQGWYEVQGLQVLDLVTLAIRAAKNYYTSHEQPQRLYAIRSERQIRTDLYSVLELLKKLAGRNFAGGIRKSEVDEIMAWATSIEQLVKQDEEAENLEHDRRTNWTWIEGDWNGREREREKLFIESFDSDSVPLPEWTVPSDDDVCPTAFLELMKTGLRLVRLHNELVKSSRRRFDLIRNFHTDTNKPYRCAENLRYWIKAAQLRWDISLDVDVSGVVRGNDAKAWVSFDKAILKWCSALREELTKEWKDHRESLKRERPIVRMDQYDESMPIQAKGDWTPV